MRNDHAPGCNLWRHLRQPAGNVLVGEAVEPVAAHALRVKTLRDRVVVRKCVVATMEGGVETGDLRKIGGTGKNRTDRDEVVRLMQGRERNIALELREHALVDQYRPIELRTAVHNPMADGDRLEVLRLTQPSAGDGERRRHVGHIVRRVGLVDKCRAVGCFGLKSWPRANTTHLPLDQPLELVTPISVENLAFDALVAGVDDEDRVHRRVMPPATWPRRGARRRKAPPPRTRPCGSARSPRATSG